MLNHISKYKALADKYDLDIDVVRKVCESQFDFCKHIIQEGKDEQIRLQYIGVFSVKPNRRRLIQERTDRLRRLRDEREKNKQEKR